MCVVALAFAPSASAAPFTLELLSPAAATFDDTVVLRGAITPAYPASHGCVRVPMWFAPRLFAGTAWGQTIYVY